MPEREVTVHLMPPKAVMVRVAQELLPALEDWSEPVQVRIERLPDGSYDMIARTVAARDIASLDLKMTREALCAAQSALFDRARSGTDVQRVPGWVDRIGKVVNLIDEHRPLGPDGKHGNLHTATCGCEDR